MKHKFLLGLLVTTLALPFPAIAQSSDPAKEAMRRLQLSQRKLEDEKASLAKEKEAADARLKDASGKLSALRRQAEAAAKIAAETAAKKEAELEQALATAISEKNAVSLSLVNAEQRLARMAEQQAATEAERRRLEVLASQQKTSIAQCEDHNGKLHQHGVALLERYRSKSCFDTVSQSEPFFGLKKVQTESFIEEAREKLDENKLEQRVP
jgi:chromosome segregation ATPase